MSFLVANLPPIHCFVRREYLYNFTRGHGEYEPCIWITAKSLRGQALRIESYLPNYGALYDKLPISAYVSRDTDLDLDNFLPLDSLQIWDCFSHNLAIVQKAFLANLSCKFYAKNQAWYMGKYLFTIDNAAPDSNILDTTYAEWPEDHKSFNLIEMSNGQYAAQPNNRCIFLDAASNPKQLAFPDFHVCSVKYSVETNPKWALGHTETVMYQEQDSISPSNL